MKIGANGSLGKIRHGNKEIPGLLHSFQATEMHCIKTVATMKSPALCEFRQLECIAFKQLPLNLGKQSALNLNSSIAKGCATALNLTNAYQRFQKVH